MQVASVYHEYGRLTLATAGLLFVIIRMSAALFYWLLCIICRSVSLGMVTVCQNAIFTRNQRSSFAFTQRLQLRSESLWWSLWIISGKFYLYLWFSVISI